MSETNPESNASTETGAQDRPTRSKSRVGQPLLAPIVFEGRRYEQVMNGERLGLAQRTGYLAVYDLDSNERIATIKVYDVAFNVNKEADVQDVFFTGMRLDEATRTIIVDNERGRSFAVHLDSQTVRPMN